MRALSLGLGILGLGLTLSGCAYYPDGPYAYGPGWCNYHPYRCAAAYGPYGPPPPPGYAGPPPGYSAPPPGYPPPQGYAPPPGSAPPAQPAPPQAADSARQQSQLAKVNNPTWCNNHPRKCEELRERFGMTPPGNNPEPQQGYGPPPANGAPTPLSNGPQGAPPNH
jgi:hypothetical protein